MLFSKRCLGTVGMMLGVPANLAGFTRAWGKLNYFTAEQCRPEEWVNFDDAGMSLHDVARNDLVNRMRGDWLLMLDTDHSFDPDLVWRMIDRLDTAKIDVLTALYTYKTPPYNPVLYLKAGDLYAPLASWRPATDTALDLFPVDACGGGCLMVRRSVFDRIKKELKEEPFARIPPLGEDMSFCKRCERLGVKIYCDARIECHHLQTRPLSLADYDRTAVTPGEEKAVGAFAIVGG